MAETICDQINGKIINKIEPFLFYIKTYTRLVSVNGDAKVH